MDKKRFTANSKGYPNPLLLTVPRFCLVGCICVKKKKKKKGTILITVIFLINGAMLVFQSSGVGQWELCSKLCLSFYSGIQAC